MDSETFRIAGEQMDNHDLTRKESTMEREWEKYFREVDPYVPGEQPERPDAIKLNTNENPYPPSPKALEALKGLDYTSFRRYPAPEADSLEEAIAENYGLKRENVFAGVGSDDVLALSFLTFFNSEKPVLFPEITYSFYSVWAKLLKVKYETVPLVNFEIRPEDYRRENGGIVIANPNAPTGVLLPLEAVEDIVRNNQKSVVIVDEAYIDFGGTSALPLTRKYENLLIVQTFSKSRAFAGLRIGYAMGDRNLISAIKRVKNSFNSYPINTPAIVLGTAVAKDRAYYEGTIKKVTATRERVKKELKSLGFLFSDSMTNFIFARREGTSAVDLMNALREKNIFVRHFGTPLLKDYLRITIGTDAEMDAFLAATREYLKEHGEL